MGEVVLGLPGPWADDKSEVSDHYTTKIGGFPDWPVETGPVRSDLLLCDACGSNLALVAQVYAPVSSAAVKIEERIIYVFGCVLTKCTRSPSWRALRVQKSTSNETSNLTCHKVVVPPTISSHSVPVMEELWTSDSREDDDDIDLAELSRAFSRAAIVASNPPKQTKKSPRKAIVRPSTVISKAARAINDNIPVLPCFYIYTQEEAPMRRSSSKSVSISPLLVKESQSDVDNQEAEEKWEAESYEYDRALNADRTYLKFKKRMDAYPEQCFRYSYSGKPLLATGEAPNPGICKLCGRLRHYEMQLMPPLLYFIQEENLDCENHSLDNWNWMTLFVYTCAANCFNSNQENSGGWIFADEEVIIQYE